MTVAEVAAPPTLAVEAGDIVAAADVVVPTLVCALRLAAEGGEVRALTLNVQVRIDAARRAYAPGDESLLYELFGERARWSRTMRSLLWLNGTLSVPRFTGTTIIDLRLPATYDFEVAAAKYLNALADGEVPLELTFGGTLFYTGEDGRLQAAPVPAELECRSSLPVATWRDAIDAAFPSAAWLRIDRDAFDRLWRHRAGRALPSWEATIDDLLGQR